VPARLDGLSFFFPALNEEDNVAPIVEEALAVLPRFADDFEITVVDDGSSDRTGAIADELATKDPRVRVIHHGTRRGYGGAVRSGLRAATKNWIFFTDGDRQFALEDLGLLVAVSDGVDAVVGFRKKRADPARRRVPLERVRSNGAFFSPELLITLRRAGVRVRQVGVRHFPRTAHEPKGASPRVIARAIRDLVRLRARLWLHPRD